MLDIDATDDPPHGHQLGRFFHGDYDAYCYLPLYVFCGDHPLLALKLLKIGAVVRITVRKVWVAFSEAYVWQQLFHRVYQRLSAWRGNTAYHTA